MPAQSDASQSLGVSASSAAPASGPSVPSSEHALVPSEATDGGETGDGVDAIDLDSDNESTEGKDANQSARKRVKRPTSEVWNYFDKYTVIAEVNGKPDEQLWAKCNFKGCKNKTSKHRAESRFGTTGFWTHLWNYHSVKKGQTQLTTKKDNDTGIAIVKPYKYDQEASLKKFYEAMIVHEYPFNMVEHEYFQEWVKSLRPHYPLKCRVTVRKEIYAYYLAEKEKLYAYFKTINSRFSATMDMWTSNQNKGYMCLTLHWVDDDWKMQKRIINFFHVEGRHTGERLSYTVSSCLLKWYVEKKMFSLTLDNASANEVAVKDLIVELKKHSQLVCDGLFFHVRCANHILNLVVKDGMRVITCATEKVRAFVIAVKGSTVQWEEFLKCATECGLDTKPSLSLDVSTRWNSTYLMLRDALYYKAAFERLTSIDRRRYGSIAPSAQEWEKAKILLPFLKKFYELTEIFSGTSYPTANLFFRGFCEIKILLTDWCNSSDPTICEMATAMNVKFDKYWKKSNVALAVANVLDPRFKRKIVEFYLRKIYRYSYNSKLEKFNGVLRKMYQCYASTVPSSSKSSAAPSAIDQFMDSVDNELDSYLFESDSQGADGQLNELDKYLASAPLKTSKSEQNSFDILAYWKTQKEDYPVLASLARDVLAMQVSTVASESAFSAGGRVVDPYRSRLDPDMVEALVCTKDWITAARRGESSNSKLVVGLKCTRNEHSN